jgi:hypothetical protein
MTTDEIKTMFDIAGIPHTLVHNANDYTKLFVAIEYTFHYCGDCYHDSEDEAYACMWKAFIGETNE